MTPPGVATPTTSQATQSPTRPLWRPRRTPSPGPTAWPSAARMACGNRHQPRPRLATASVAPAVARVVPPSAEPPPRPR